MMTRAAKNVLATINAPYGANLSAQQLAQMIADPESAVSFDASVFAFFSEVVPSLQSAFISEMGVDAARVRQVARAFATRSGFQLALAFDPNGDLNASKR
jgi:hypothetical protein